jgi:hypothetical protein
VLSSASAQLVHPFRHGSERVWIVRHSRRFSSHAIRSAATLNYLNLCYSTASESLRMSRGSRLNFLNLCYSTPDQSFQRLSADSRFDSRRPSFLFSADFSKGTGFDPRPPAAFSFLSFSDLARFPGIGSVLFTSRTCVAGLVYESPTLHLPASSSPQSYGRMGTYGCLPTENFIETLPFGFR